MLNNRDCLIQGELVPAELLGELRETTFRPNDGDRLRERLTEDGYLLLRGVIDIERVMAARDEVFGRLMEVGEIKPPARDGIFTGTSRRTELRPGYPGGTAVPGA